MQYTTSGRNVEACAGVLYYCMLIAAILNSLATVMVSTAEFIRFVIPTWGILTVAVQLYWPLSDVLSGESTSELLPGMQTSVEFGNIIFKLGSTTRPATTLAEQCRE